MTRAISAGSTNGRAARISTLSGGSAASASSPERTESCRSPPPATGGRNREEKLFEAAS
jgi:hypothetical protein